MCVPSQYAYTTTNPSNDIKHRQALILLEHPGILHPQTASLTNA